MTARQIRSRAPPSIAVGMMNQANAQLLEQLLGSHYQLHHGLPDMTTPGPGNDLIIVDGSTLQRQRVRIRELRSRASPVILPVLLVADSRAGDSAPPCSRTGASCR
jgi:hypothetical protein